MSFSFLYIVLKITIFCKGSNKKTIQNANSIIISYLCRKKTRIMLYLNDNLEEISNEDVERLINNLPPQRREKARQFKFALGRKECALAYELLCKGLREEYGIEEKPVFRYGEHGKPSIIGHEDIHFNMSHCKNAVMCYVSDKPVGIDCEAIDRGNESLINYTMNAEERKQINCSASPLTEFIKFWTKKEAVLKLSGEGINDDVKSVLLPENIKGINIKTFVNEDKGYAYSIATYL